MMQARGKLGLTRAAPSAAHFSAEPVCRRGLALIRNHHRSMAADSNPVQTGETLNQFAKDARLAGSLSEVDKTFANCIGALGIKRYVYVLADVPFMHPRAPLILSNLSSDWLEGYVEDALYLDDPLLQVAVREVLVFDWRILHEKRNLTPNAALFHRRAASYGITTGLTVPLHGPGPIHAALSLLTNEPVADATNDPLWRLDRPTCYFLGLHLHDAARRLQIKLPKAGAHNDLSARELECLLWAARGKTSWETAIILDVAEPTVNYHLTNAMKKLDVFTRPHAIARVVAMGLIYV